MTKKLPRYFALGIVALAALTLILSFCSPLSRAIQKGEPVFGLLVGTDFVDNARHSDTIALVRYDPSVYLARLSMRHFATPLVGVVPALVRYDPSAKAREPPGQAQWRKVST